MAVGNISPSKVPLPARDVDPILCMVPWDRMRVHFHNGISIGSVGLQGSWT